MTTHSVRTDFGDMTFTSDEPLGYWWERIHMKTFVFNFTHQSRAVVISGQATVVGDYDGPSKPEAMIRSLFASNTHEIELALLSEPTDVVPADGDA